MVLAAFCVADLTEAIYVTDLKSGDLRISLPLRADSLGPGLAAGSPAAADSPVASSSPGSTMGLPTLESSASEHLFADATPEEVEQQAELLAEYEGSPRPTRTIDEAAQEYGYREHSVDGDGSCQYRALGHQLGRLGYSRSDTGAAFTEADYRLLRQIAADHLERNRGVYEHSIEIPDGSSLDEAWDNYIRGVRGSEWGDELTLRAFSREFDLNILVIRTLPEVSVMRRPLQPTDRAAILGHRVENHYGSLVPDSGLDEGEVQVRRAGVASLVGEAEVDQQVFVRGAF